MCDYSLHQSRPANIGDKLITRNFNTGTRGFASPDDRTTAVCILPGTELAFSEDVNNARANLWFLAFAEIICRTFSLSAFWFDGT